MGNGPIYRRTGLLGKGIGTKLVQAAITYIMENEGAEAIAMDPKVNNERAIKCSKMWI